MKKHMIYMLTLFLSVSCNGQKNETNNSELKENSKNYKKEPKGTWKVDKEFDKDGNLIRYDSVYSWSSSNKLNSLSSESRDSLIQQFKSKFFTDFSRFENENFDDVFSQDSVFSNHFFKDNFFESDFGNDFMNIDRIRQQIFKREKAFLKKYQSELNSNQKK